jgi:Tol biopolymer transport system component
MGGTDPGIFLIEADGRKMRRLTHGVDYGPKWDPLGRSIAFTRREGTKSVYRWGTYVLWHLRSLQRIALGKSPTWGPSGNALALIRDGEIIEIKLPSLKERKVAYMPLADRLAWSPDGQEIAIAGAARQIVLVRVVDGERSVLRSGAFGDTSMSWDQTGRRLFFSSEVRAAGQESAAIRSYDRVSRTFRYVWRATDQGATGASADSPSVSPEGAYLAFSLASATWPVRVGVYVLRLGERRGKLLTSREIIAGGPAWQPQSTATK